MQEERRKRYADLRASAAEIGVAMPETPPWEAAWPQDDAAMRQRREEMQTRMQSMTPEERQAMREERWQKRRAEAAERGIDMPETPPWKEAEKRREEMAKRFEEYRSTVAQMTDEQREAAQAVFGRGAAKRTPPMPYHDHDADCDWGYPPARGVESFDPRNMTYPPTMPYRTVPGHDQPQATQPQATE